jgi:mRNA interferase RelE/StbE
MPGQFLFRPKALAQFNELPHNVRIRISEKLRWYEETQKPLDFGKHLKTDKFGTYRFRVGNYRLLCDVFGNENILILAIGNRKDIYR